MSADEVAGWLGELLSQSRVDQNTGQVQELCRLLRGVGFSGQWIQDFTEGRVRLGNIKRWTKGVEVNDVSGKDELLNELRAFADAGYKVKDLIGYDEAKKTIDAVPISFAQCTEFAEGLLKIDADVNGLLKLNGELAGTGLNAKGILRTNELRKNLDNKGLNMAVEEKIWEAANRHGSGEEILKVIAAGETLEAVIRQVMDQKKIHDELAIEITKRDTSLKDLVAKTASYQGHIEVAKTLFKSGFDLNACNELITAAGKYGSAPGVIGAVNDYNSLTDLNSVVRARKEEIAAMGDSIKKLQGEYTALMKQNAEAYQLLGQIDEKYRRSMYLQHVASIIDNPRGARIPLPELARISVAFMNGFMICAEASPDQNRKLIDAVRGYVDHLITSLNGFLRGV